jgi:hypothetical protein
MARTRNDSWGVAQSVDVTTRDAAERRSVQAQSEYLYADPFAQVPPRRGWRPWLVMAAIRQAYGRAVAGRASAASSAGASPIGTNRVAYEGVRRILHCRRLHQCPATLRICCCRGIAVVVVLVAAISWTALGGGMIPAAADQPMDDTTAAPAPRPAPAPGPPPAQGPRLPTGPGTADGPLTEPPGRTPFMFIPSTTNPTPGWRRWTPMPPAITPTPPPAITPTPPPAITPTPPPAITPTTTPPPAITPTTTPTPPAITPTTTPTPPPTTTPTPPPVTTPTTPTVTTPVVPTDNEHTGGGGALALLLAVVLALLLSAGLFTRARRHRGVSWMKAHVTVAPQPGPGATFETCPGDDPNRDHVLCVVPVEIRRSTTVEEDPL